MGSIEEPYEGKGPRERKEPHALAYSSFFANFTLRSL